MSGERLKEGLEGLSKIKSFESVLEIAIYWIAVIFVILFVSYLFSTFICYINKRKRGTLHIEKDDYLDD